MKSLLIVIGLFLVLGLIAYFNRHVPDAEELAFETRFDREAILVKTCASDPGLASGGPLKVYRFQNELWFKDVWKWRRVDGKADNVCDLLDIDAAHRTRSADLPSPTGGTVSHILDFFRKPEATPIPPKEIPPAKPNG